MMAPECLAAPGARTGSEGRAAASVRTARPGNPVTPRL